MFLEIHSDIFITILGVNVLQNFQASTGDALRGKTTFLRPSPAFCKLIDYLCMGGTMVAVFDA